MKRTVMTQIWILFLVLACLHGCKDAEPVGPAAVGSYDLCTYTQGLESSGYASARVSYPCPLPDRLLPAVTLTGGYTNIKESMFWLADHLSTHGFIVITVTPHHIFGSIDNWQQAHTFAYAKLLEENQRPESPIYERIDLGKMVMAGYSNGGAGALRAAFELGDAVHSVVGLAPYFPLLGAPDISALSANTLLLSGQLDSTALPYLIEQTHEDFLDQKGRLYAKLSWVTHYDWISIGRFHNKFASIILPWLELSLYGQSEYESFLTGQEHQAHLEQGWYKEFRFER